jgi:cell division septum initiation protein DivIVA
MHASDMTAGLDEYFDIERRGYSKEQVGQYVSESRHRESKLLEMVEHLKREVRTVTQQRNWEISQSQGKNAQIDGLQQKVVQLTAYSEELTQNPTSNFALGLRIQKIFTLAEEESRSTLSDAERQAGEILRGAQEKSEKIAELSERQRLRSQELELKTRSECAKAIEEARADARVILEEARRLKSEAESEASELRSSTEAALQVEAADKRRKIEAFLRSQEDEALRNARSLVEEAERNASEMIREAQLAVAAHHRDYSGVKLSRDAAIWQITTMKDALEELLQVEQAETPRI